MKFPLFLAAMHVVFWLGFVMRDISPSPIPPIRIFLFAFAVSALFVTIDAIEEYRKGKSE